MDNAVEIYDPNKSLSLMKVGDGLFKSGLFPNAKNGYGAYAIVQYGYELGIGPMMALKNINIISGQVACNAQLMLTLALKKGVTYHVLEEGDKGAKIRFKRGDVEYVSTFTEDDAKAAGLLGKDNWKKYPRDMYFWRAAAKGVRRVAPDAVMGLYTAEEISDGQFTDVSQIPAQGTGPGAPPEDPKPLSPAAIRQKKLADLAESISAKAALMGIDQEEGYTAASFIRQTMGLHLGRTINSANDITDEEIDDYLIAAKEDAA